MRPASPAPAVEPPPSPPPTEAEIEDAILALLAKRRPGASICPSEAARHLRPAGWRRLMPEVRRVAARLAREGRLVMLQAGKPVDPATIRGPIRLACSG